MLYFMFQVCLQRVAKPVEEILLAAASDGFEGASEPQFASVKCKFYHFLTFGT